jgi:hypothetical protein
MDTIRRVGVRELTASHLDTLQAYLCESANNADETVKGVVREGVFPKWMCYCNSHLQINITPSHLGFILLNR